MSNLNRGFLRKMLTLAIPIALQQLLVSSAQIVDTAMVAGLGDVTVAAVGIATRWTFLMNLFLFGASSGAAALISQFWGAKDNKSIRKSYCLAMMMSMGVAAVFTLCTLFIPQLMIRVFTAESAVIEAGATYLRIVGMGSFFLAFNMITCTVLRSTENVKTPLVTSMVSVFANTALNYILIYGKLAMPRLGLKGAAIASFTAAAVQAVLLLAISKLRSPIMRSPAKSFFGFNGEFARRFFRVCLPVVANEGIWALGMNIYSMIYARQGSGYYAGYTIFSSVEQITFVLFVGICHSCSIMTGKTIGKGDENEAYKIARRFLVMTPIFGVLSGVLLFFVRNPLLGLMNIETQLAFDTASKLLLLYGCWLPIRNIPYVMIVGTFRAGGDTKIGIFLDCLTLYGFGIPLTLFFGFCKPIDFVWLVAIMYLCDDIIKSIICLKRFRSRKWIKNLTYSK